jgi:predicted DNA-binding transcriptional regulator
MYKAGLVDYFYPELPPEEKHKELIQKFKDELEKLGNPSKSELIKNNINLYIRIQRADLLDIIFPELSPEEKRNLLIQKLKDELQKLGNPSKTELYKTHKKGLYKKIWKAGLVDYFYPELPPEEKHKQLIAYFKDELQKLGNPSKSELFINHYSLYQRMYKASMLYYFFPKKT